MKKPIEYKPLPPECISFKGIEFWLDQRIQLTPLGNALDNAAGSREFTIIVNRTGSNNDPVMNAPLQNLCTTNRDYVTDENISGGQEIQLNQ